MLKQQVVGPCLLENLSMVLEYGAKLEVWLGKDMWSSESLWICVTIQNEE